MVRLITKTFEQIEQETYSKLISLGIDKKIINKAKQLVKRIKHFNGHRIGMCLAAVYVASIMCDMHIPVSYLRDNFDVHQKTIYKYIYCILQSSDKALKYEGETCPY